MKCILGVIACFVISLSCGATCCRLKRNCVGDEEDEITPPPPPIPPQKFESDDNIYYQSLTVSPSDDVVDRGNDCAVCLTDFSSSEKLTLIGCGHYYHKKCYEKWKTLKGEKVTCPTCRGYIRD